MRKLLCNVLRSTAIDLNSSKKSMPCKLKLIREIFNIQGEERDVTTECDV